MKAESIIQRRMTQELINANPTMLRFHRTRTTRKANGGVEQVPAGTTAPQRVFVSREKAGNKGSTTTSGVMDRQDVRLVAMPDADIKAGDTFEFEDTTWEVGHTVTKGYELYAVVHPRGDDGER